MAELDAQARQERAWAMASHLSALAGYLIPLGHLLGPLIVWLIKRDRFPLANDQGKESLNFQISLTIYAAVSALLILVLIGFVLLIAVAVADIVFVILAGLKAYQGERYRYPLCIRLVS